MTQALSVVVPVYNSQHTLTRLVSGIAQVLSAHFHTYEIILVDDGSSDESWQTIRSLACEHPYIAGLRLRRNMGQHAASIAGLQAARQPLSITMDDDFEHPPEHIPLLYAALRPGIDIVYAGPQRHTRSVRYLVMATAARIMMAVAGRALFLYRMQTYRLLRTAIYPWQTLDIQPCLTLDGLLASQKPKAVRIRIPYGQGIRPSTYSFSSLLKLVLRICLTAMLRRPLHCPTQASPNAASHAVCDRAGWLEPETHNA